MPLFELRCSNCSTEDTDRVYEVLMSITERDSEIKCPECGAKLERLISASNWVIH